VAQPGGASDARRSRQRKAPCAHTEPMTKQVSYCRICQASCGVIVEVEDNRVLQVKGDRDNALSGGFTCPKGRRGADFHNGPQRLRQSQRRSPEGTLVPIEVDVAIAEIAAQLTAIIAEHGVDSVAVFQGTQSTFASLTRPFLQAWMSALGSHKYFSTMTIDQSAKWIVPLRMGEYLGGRQRFEDSDVWMLAGTNPMVSLNAGNWDGPLVNDPSARLRAARARGLQLIVIDPRRTETAARADLHLQPRPGHDALVFAGLLNVIFSENLYDVAFCAQFADQVDDLREMIAGVTPALVERCANVPADDLIRAARIFATASRGMVSTGTGVCMGPNSNVAEHLAICLNVVCGRYLRVGEATGMPSVLAPLGDPRAEVSPPDRTWDRDFRSRIGGVGQLRGQVPCGIFAEELLQPGADRVRALIVCGGNPVAALPDRDGAVRALESLELLVTIDPRLSETAQLADFVIAPTLFYERTDHTSTLEPMFPIPFAQYTSALVTPPVGVIEDWQFVYRLAAAMGLQLVFAGQPLDMTSEPTSEALLDMFAASGRISVDEVRRHPHGVTIPPPDATVGPASSDEAAAQRLQLLPADVRAEFEIAVARSLADVASDQFPLRLVVRRMREVMNSLGRDVDGLAEHSYNPAYLNPDDMSAMGLTDSQTVEVRSAHGWIHAVAHADAKVRPGVLSMTHCWGGPISDTTDPRSAGSNVNDLLTVASDYEAINRMPTMSAVPVSVVAV
jgi:anaerobic selenocysteine-containing dehydrogenase